MQDNEDSDPCFTQVHLLSNDHTLPSILLPPHAALKGTLTARFLNILATKIKNYKYQNLKKDTARAIIWMLFVNTNGVFDVAEDVMSFNMIPNMGCVDLTCKNIFWSILSN